MDVKAHFHASPVAIALLTFRREELLPRLLPELARQAALLDRPTRVIVVDNDPRAGARRVVEGLALPQVEYYHEPRPGIAAARNAAIAEAGDTGVIVFIDDDETPERDWLRSIVSAHERMGCAAVAGPVTRTYAVEPGPRIRGARVFDRRRLQTGASVEAASTANLLLDLSHVRRHGLAFDDRLGISGGSDHLFTRQLRRSGGEIRWCDEAVVNDPVPASRLTPRWVLARGYRSGNTEAVVSRLLASSVSERAWLRTRALIGGVGRIVAGTTRIVAGAATGNPEREGIGAWTTARGAGMVGAALGHHYFEYRRVDATQSSPHTVR